MAKNTRYKTEDGKIVVGKQEEDSIASKPISTVAKKIAQKVGEKKS